MKNFKLFMLFALFAFSPLLVSAQQEIDKSQVIEKPDISDSVVDSEANSIEYYNHFQESESQNEEVTEKVEPRWTDYLSTSLKLAVAILMTSLLLAGNHLTAGTFKFSVWWEDSAKPTLITFAIALVLLALDMFVKSIDVILEQMFGISTDYNDHNTIAAAAIILLPIIKGFMRKDKTQAKVASKNNY
jgi:hypothetical protein